MNKTSCSEKDTMKIDHFAREKKFSFRKLDSLHPLFRILFLLTLLTSACNMPGLKEAGSPTPDVTQAYQTIQARLTEAATQLPPASPTTAPSQTPASSGSPTSGVATSTRPATSTPPPTAGTKLCDQAEPGTPIDVTIPDDTSMTPGQAFTKVWRLRNAGTCSWSKNYSIAVFSGEAMNAANSIPIPKQVDPGQTMDISADLIAPTSPGTYQGNWKLRNASGTWFGIGPGGSSPFWVRIVVSGGTTTPGTTTITPSVTTSVNNPSVMVSGANTMAVNDRLNLDTNTLNSGGEDITLTPNAQGRLLLATLGSAGMVGFGGNAPTYDQCVAAGAGSATVSMRNVPQGFYICHRTDQGFYGWIRITAFNEANGTLTVQINTWNNP